MLVVIDPVVAYLPSGKNSHNDQEVRQVSLGDDFFGEAP